MPQNDTSGCHCYISIQAGIAVQVGKNHVKLIAVQTRISLYRAGFLCQIYSHTCMAIRNPRVSPIFTIFRILVNNDSVHLSYHYGCHRNHFGGNVCVTIDTKVLNY